MALRSRLRADLAALEAEVRELGSLAERQLARAMDALARRDPSASEAVVAGDDELDERYLDVERRILDLLALQTPVATDLRLLTALLHVNLHLERVGDQAVNIAKLALVTMDLPADETIVALLREMGDLVRRMLRTAMDALARRDLEASLSLPGMDDPVDALNRGMYRRVVALAGDPDALAWGVRMNVVARQLERAGDNAVDIGEQVAFLLTGEFREFTDASHTEGDRAGG